MASSDKQDKPAMWQEYIRAWQHSGMTQQAYCEANGALRPGMDVDAQIMQNSSKLWEWLFLSQRATR